MKINTQLPLINLKTPISHQKTRTSKQESTTLNPLSAYGTFNSSTSRLLIPRNYELAIDYYSKNLYNNLNNNPQNSTIANKTNILFLIKRSICYLAKGYYTLALKDALKTIELDSTFAKGYYIASLSYLEMYDIENAEKYSLNSNKNSKNKNQRLIFLLEKKKNDIKHKCQKFKLYPKYIYFIQCLYKYDSFFPKLEIHFYTNDDRGVIAKTNIKNNEIIMRIPKECLISLETAMETEVGKKISQFMYTELNSPKHCLLSSYYLQNETSERWKFYFDLFPKNFDNFPIFYNETELSLLKGSPFLLQIYEKKSEMKADYDKICSYIPAFKNYSYIKFCQARMLISSRIFGITMNDKKTDVLAPFADLLNHRRPKQSQWYFDDASNCFIVQATEDIEAGGEIFDSYGRKSNNKFLMNYGFCLEDNDCNEYPLTLNFNENCPLFEVKKNFFASDYEYIKTFRLNNCIGESEIFDLLSFLRFLIFDGDINCLYSAMSFCDEISTDDIGNNLFYVAPINKALEVKVLKHLNFILRECLKKYPTSYEEDKLLLKNKGINLSFNFKNCMYLIMAEKNILIYYIYFCEYCLDLLGKECEEEVINKVNADFKDNICEFQYYIKEVILKLI